jgi:hypothetical protein
MKTIIGGKEEDLRNQLKNYEKHENWQGYQNSEK